METKKAITYYSIHTYSTRKGGFEIIILSRFLSLSLFKRIFLGSYPLEYRCCDLGEYHRDKACL